MRDYLMGINREVLGNMEREGKGIGGKILGFGKEKGKVGDVGKEGNEEKKGAISGK